MFLRLAGRLKYLVMWSRFFTSIKSYERVEMDMRELVLHKLIQGNTHVAARVNSDNQLHDSDDDSSVEF